MARNKAALFQSIVAGSNGSSPEPLSDVQRLHNYGFGDHTLTAKQRRRYAKKQKKALKDRDRTKVGATLLSEVDVTALIATPGTHDLDINCDKATMDRICRAIRNKAKSAGVTAATSMVNDKTQLRVVVS